MTKILNDLINKLPLDQQQEIEVQATQLINQEMTLRDLRKAYGFTQKHIAEALHISQDGVSRMERRSDLFISTMSSYVEAMGGKLHLVAEFPNRNPVVISAINVLAKN
ncbi:MAG: helix-turn-helix domain-containing protein [Magnetococcales bacterium]|nr:helix-turn-helix domain-containing protein [Magnetococcales bacterium]